MKLPFFIAILGFCAVLPKTLLAIAPSGLNDKDLAQFAPISEAIRRASSLTLFEGLPHQEREPDQLKNELATKKTVRIHDYPFYEQPLALAPEDLEPLRRLSAAAETYSSYAGPKRCGGYHPDYGLAWKDGDSTYHLLICFGCQEMKLFGPKQELLADIRSDSFKQFESILKKYRAQRPKNETLSVR